MLFDMPEALPLGSEKHSVAYSAIAISIKKERQNETSELGKNEIIIICKWSGFPRRKCKLI